MHSMPSSDCFYPSTMHSVESRVMQKLNEALVAGSGVFYYNILWGHVRLTMFTCVSSLMSSIVILTT